MGGFQAQQQVDVILNATSFKRHSLKSANCSSQVLVKPVTRLRADQRPSVLGRANPVLFRPAIDPLHIAGVRVELEAIELQAVAEPG